MKKKGLEILELEGDAYTVGTRLGVRFQPYLHQIISPYEEKAKEIKIRKHLNQLEEKMNILCPESLQEVYGRADGAKIDRQAMLLLLSPELYHGEGGCTNIVLKKANGNILFAHNEDGTVYEENSVALVKCNRNGKWGIHFVIADRLIGSAFGYASNGIAYAHNYIKETKYHIEEISRYAAVRQMLTFDTIAQMRQYMTSIKIASAVRIDVVDKKNNIAIDIEKEYQKMCVTEIADRFARSNHFHMMGKEYVQNTLSSLFRYEKATALLQTLDAKTATLEDIIAILQYQEKEYDHCIYRDRKTFKKSSHSTTGMMFAFDTQMNEFWVYDYINWQKIIIGWEPFQVTKEKLPNII